MFSSIYHHESGAWTNGSGKNGCLLYLQAANPESDRSEAEAIACAKL